MAYGQATLFEAWRVTPCRGAVTASKVPRSPYRAFMPLAAWPREVIVIVTAPLAAKGWNMQGNGECTNAPSRLFEGRYRGDAERAVAERPVSDLKVARPPGETRAAVAKPARMIAPNTLENRMGPATMAPPR